MDKAYLKKYRLSIHLIFICLLVCNCIEQGDNLLVKKWSKEKAWEWYNKYDWLVGTNFIPSTAVNQLEFWQEETFDIETLDKELAWSAELGMNLHHVYLHDLLWKQDSIGFLNRIENYLTLSDKYHIKTMFVLLDNTWYPIPKLGKQLDPIPHKHNSRWVQSPGAEILSDSNRHDELEGYVKGVISHFSNDDRVICWDLYQEPDFMSWQKDRIELEAENKSIHSLALLKKVFAWARSVNPSQPLTVGISNDSFEHLDVPEDLSPIARYVIEHSDVISFHTYEGDMEVVKQKITELKKYKRPLLCTEYMARTEGNTFENMLPILKHENVAAINWGLVAGKTNTNYPWSSWDEYLMSSPKIWQHDILRQDGTPFSKSEVEFILKTIGIKKTIDR
ncbi:1,4-beta-xylanase [Flavivirga spongiicola]|uniref:1,4-beta-xylanase n=1 Tax=Flavivirga spongiicola TaxID=421621 RepID=A0ABU7XSG3_9FLAO|nr:1,4-beta-xylanase [Flavivirga sp. MEBiC05379]MDO5977879.1 1,4-beta-xylanase [Flavivirga sp. MEBiC05379]